jgi:hypothetical protein
MEKHPPLFLDTLFRGGGIKVRFFFTFFAKSLFFILFSYKIDYTLELCNPKKIQKLKKYGK